MVSQAKTEILTPSSETERQRSVLLHLKTNPPPADEEPQFGYNPNIAGYVSQALKKGLPYADEFLGRAVLLSDNNPPTTLAFCSRWSLKGVDRAFRSRE
jgi:hypothetical protein